MVARIKDPVIALRTICAVSGIHGQVGMPFIL